MLNTIDLTLDLDRDTYEKELVKYQVALFALAYQVYVQQRPVVMVFEGWDAAGKGGAIRRLTEKIDPRGFTVYPIGAPTGEDASHHYLYRFWRRLPENGQIAIFDRSWYGRVLVERVEGYAQEDEWRRAYREINQFERQLADADTIILKFWLHISPEEQLRRFEERAADPLRAWKLTADDWRNRDKWDLYAAAVNDMLLKTSTLTARWTVVEGNSKLYARVKVVRTVVEQLSAALDYDPFNPPPLPEGGKSKKKKKKGKDS
jgi:polyphosphate kinase 2 (PPK2 family)